MNYLNTFIVKEQVILNEVKLKVILELNVI